MRRFSRFWWECACRAAIGNTAFANDWQWLFGIPVFAGLVTYVVGAQTARQMTITENAIADGVIAAFAAFLLTWALAFVVRFFNAPVVMYDTERARADILEREKEPRLTCNDICIWNNSEECFVRVQLQNLSSTDLKGVKPYLDNIESDDLVGQIETIDFKLRLYSQERWRERFATNSPTTSPALPIDFSAKQSKLFEVFQITKSDTRQLLRLTTTAGRKDIRPIWRADFRCSVYVIINPIEFKVTYEAIGDEWRVSLVNEQGNTIGPRMPVHPC